MLIFGEVSSKKVWRSQWAKGINYSRQPGKWLSWSNEFKSKLDKSLVLDDAVVHS